MSFWVEYRHEVILFVSTILAGSAAFMAGRALAKGWKPVWLLVAYMFAFAAGVRFLHYALFQERLVSLPDYLLNLAILLAIALLGYRLTRVNQMTEQYPWLYEKAGPFGWRNKA